MAGAVSALVSFLSETGWDTTDDMDVRNSYTDNTTWLNSYCWMPSTFAGQEFESRLLKMAAFPFIKRMERRLKACGRASSSWMECLALAAASFFTCFTAPSCHPPRVSTTTGRNCIPSRLLKISSQHLTVLNQGLNIIIGMGIRIISIIFFKGPVKVFFFTKFHSVIIGLDLLIYKGILKFSQ